MNDMVPIQDGLPTKPVRAVYQVIDPVPILDTARFEHMQRIAGIMARSSLVPEALASSNMPIEQAVANCFLAVNQAVRWDMDPFAVAQCLSVVKGKLCFEGKLIAAVIESKLGIKLQYEWNNGQGDALAIVVSGTFPGEKEPKTVQGTVKEWKTTHSGSPWGVDPRKQLAYRGAREWGRLHAPGIMLGVYSDDEMEGLVNASRSSRAVDVTPPRRAPSASAPTIEHRPETAPKADPQPEQKTPEKPAQARRAPSATQAPPKTPPATTPYDPEKVRVKFAEAAKAAMDTYALDDAWNDIVAPVYDDALLPDQDDWHSIYKLRRAELDGQEGVGP